MITRIYSHCRITRSHYFGDRGMKAITTVDERVGQRERRAGNGARKTRKDARYSRLTLSSSSSVALLGGVLVAAMANAPDRFALFILGPDEKRVEITEDTHIANAATVVLNKEDHTLGNMLRQ